MFDFPLHLIGKIVRLQLQRSTLSLGEKPNRYYDPSALRAVDELTLTPQGALARLPEGDLLDVHHARHPRSKNADGENDLSVNFTSHYDAIRQRFGDGDHLYNGCGGENILVAGEGRLSLDALAPGIAIRSAKTGDLTWLRSVLVARPCKPFSKYISHATEPEAIKEVLQFLDEGMRGFYCALEGDKEATVAVGDEVLIQA
jgi:hypothetical protein